MGDIKRRNRSLPLHPDMQAGGMHGSQFFEQIIRDEIDKVMHKAYDSEKVHHYPEMTSDMMRRVHHIQ